MKRCGLILALILLLGVNAFVLAGVAYNRSGEPDAIVALSEGEFYVPYTSPYSDHENTGVVLRLKLNHGYSAIPGASGVNTFPWFDQAKLQALGFDCSLPPTSPKAKEQYRKSLQRKAYAVVEFEGKSWHDWAALQNARFASLEEDFRASRIAQKAYDSAKKEFEPNMQRASHLFVVDVGKNPIELRRTYPDRSRYIITLVSVSLRFVEGRDSFDNGKVPRLEGYVHDVLINTIHVPSTMHETLQPWLIDRVHGKKPCKITLKYGKRYEPWIAEIQPM